MGTIFTRWMAIVLAGLLLQGCGFHMRGNGIPSELMTMKVVGDNKSDFYRMVTTRLKASGVTLADKEGIPVLTLGGVGSTSSPSRCRASRLRSSPSTSTAASSTSRMQRSLPPVSRSS